MQPATRSEEVANILCDEILGGQYRPGERLPSERELAARFSVNRGAVREALKKLQQLGIANITPGGVRVVPVEDATFGVLGPMLNLDDVPDPRLISQIFEILTLLISTSAENAITTASTEDVERLQDIVERMKAVRIEAGESERPLWRELALAFVEINQNLVLRLILNGIRMQFMARLYRPRLNIDIHSDSRTGILNDMTDAIEQRDSTRLGEAVRRYFTLIDESVQIALRQQSRDVANG